ncbi:MAG: carboxypeptidase-like regulatory domain-containing protein, partial [Bacteroidota bacterium]
MSIFCTSTAIAQNSSATITGKVLDAKGEVLPGITVILEGTDKGAVTDAQGNFEIKNLKPSNYSLIISGVGYVRQSKTILLKNGQSLKLNFTLQENTQQLDEVIVRGKTDSQIKREQPIKVESINVERILGQSTSVPELINQTSGVKVRQASGVGSATTININGLQGNAVRFFRD